jgi:histidinol-phosphate aminotransferase
VAAIAAAEGLAAHGASVVARAERAASAALEPDDPVDLLRRPEPVEAYPAEPSDEELAARAGVDVSDVVRADMNTLGGGALPSVASALATFPVQKVPEYGDLAYGRLRAALGERLGVDPRRILPGAGADELIRLVTTAAVGHGDAAVIPTPTFAMFAVEARLAGARVVALPRTNLACRLTADVIRDAAERESARLVWLCTPNNPTGDVTPLGEIRAIADGLPALVVVDEVYLEFAEEEAGLAPNSTSAVTLQEELPNVLVLRSLSKAYAMASARVGYLVLPDGLVDRFDAIRLPLSIGAASEAIALAVLGDQDAARERRARIVQARQRLADTLRAVGAEVLDARTNFVPFRPAGLDAATVDEALLARGVAVRRYDAGPMAGWLRATARLDGEEERLLAALKEVLA